jgi:hypothetical protein
MLRTRCDSNIKTDLCEVGNEDGKWIKYSQGHMQQQILILLMLNPQYTPSQPIL